MTGVQGVGEPLGRDLPIVIPGTQQPPVEIGAGDPTDCATDCDLDHCLVCGEPICPEHDKVSECVEGGWHHNDSECEWFCIPCQYAAAEDAQHDRADAIRRGNGDLPRTAGP